MIDAVDTEILTIIQRDARISNAEIARQIDLAPSAVLERLRKLEDRGVIKGYSTRIDPRQVGMGLTVFISVRTSECGGGVEEALAAAINDDDLKPFEALHDVLSRPYDDQGKAKARYAEPAPLDGRVYRTFCGT